MRIALSAPCMIALVLTGCVDGEKAVSVIVQSPSRLEAGDCFVPNEHIRAAAVAGLVERGYASDRSSGNRLRIRTFLREVSMKGVPPYCMGSVEGAYEAEGCNLGVSHSISMSFQPAELHDKLTELVRELSVGLLERQSELVP